MIELVGDHVSERTSHSFADCGRRRGSQQQMQNKNKTSAQRVFAPPEHGTATDPSSDLSLRSLPHAIESSPSCLDSCQQVAAAWLSLPDFHLLDEQHILAIEIHIGAEANPRPSLRTPT